jgi:hypothetical protein
LQLGKLASYAHLDLNNSPVAHDGGEALQRDLDSILGCMRILQVGLIITRVFIP